MDEPTPGPQAPDSLRTLSRPAPAPPAPPGRRGRRRRGEGGRLLIPFLAGLVGVGAGIGSLFLAGVLPAPPPTTVVERQVVRTEVVRPEQPFRTATQIAEEVIPSIVQVQILEDDRLVGSGSGVVYRADGYVITNEHVVRDAQAIEVVFSDGRIYPAEVVGTDRHTDLAVLTVPTSNVAPISLGSTEEARVGDPAIAVGSPLGLEGGPSVTVGVISAFNRRLDTVGGSLFGMLQTDAPITRGSSGGALVDPHGRLLGITTAIAVSDVGAEGLGFATPVEVVQRVADDLIGDGEVRHAFLGIEGRTIFDQAPDGSEIPGGARIENLLPESAIAQSGARVGDVIVALEEEAITTMEELVVELRRYRAGDRVLLTVRRGSERVTLEVVLDRRPDDL